MSPVISFGRRTSTDPAVSKCAGTETFAEGSQHPRHGKRGWSGKGGYPEHRFSGMLSPSGRGKRRKQEGGKQYRKKKSKHDYFFVAAGFFAEAGFFAAAVFESAGFFAAGFFAAVFFAAAGFFAPGFLLAAAVPAAPFLYRGLCGGETGNRYAERRGGYVIHSRAATELDRFGVSAVFTANTDLEFAFRGASLLDARGDQQANTFLVQALERISAENAGLVFVNVIEEELSASSGSCPGSSG